MIHLDSNLVSATSVLSSSHWVVGPRRLSRHFRGFFSVRRSTSLPTCRILGQSDDDYFINPASFLLDSQGIQPSLLTSSNWQQAASTAKQIALDVIEVRLHSLLNCTLSGEKEPWGLLCLVTGKVQPRTWMLFLLLCRILMRLRSRVISRE